MLVIVAYGETEDNANKVFSGNKPSLLTDNGKELADQFAEALAGIQFTDCFCALNLAAQETARRITSLSFVDHHYWNEPSGGNYEGHKFSELKKMLPPRQYRVWDRDYFVAPPAGESLADASERVFKAFQKVEEILKTDPTRNVLIVTGPVVLKLLLGKLQGLEESDVLGLEPLPLPYSFDRLP